MRPFLLLLLVVVVTARNEPAAAQPQPTSKAAQGDSTSAWSYREPGTAPAVWGALRPEWVACSRGAQQSPVNIVTANVEHNREGAIKPLLFNYRFSKADLISQNEKDAALSQKHDVLLNDGRVVYLNYEPGSAMQTSLHGEDYELKRLEFHAPSEHTLNGRHYAMEMQLIHVSEAGNRAHISLLFEIGADNGFLNSIHWDALPANGGEGGADGVINANAAFPFDMSFFHYQGSMTSPPCKEGVMWFILQQPVQMSSSQLERLSSLLKGSNNRATMPLNNRKVFSSRFGVNRGPADSSNATPSVETAPVGTPAYIYPELKPEPVQSLQVPVAVINLAAPTATYETVEHNFPVTAETVVTPPAPSPIPTAPENQVIPEMKPTATALIQRLKTELMNA